MFTGLVEELAVILRINVTQSGAQMELAADLILSDMHLGDSIAVNGVCLTAVRITPSSFVVEAVPETMRRTNLGRLQVGDHVHTERAMAAGGRFGGHIVSGHIDGTGQVVSVRQDGMARVIDIETESELLKYIVEKGSICVDGVSLTVMTALQNRFNISIIPHTQGVTRLGHAKVGDVVNLECDVIAKYVERLLGVSGANNHATASSLDMNFLQKHGFA